MPCALFVTLLNKKKIVKVAELVRALGVPRPFMRKILQRLSKEKILKSSKGQAGGFKLKLLPAKIFIMQIMHIFQGQVGLNKCFLKKDARIASHQRNRVNGYRNRRPA